ncbi:MAG: hypothetical protein MI753_07360 [Hyphomicrobiales bacterium]|nr:hypothetical protein [Hyphomicrobiales bacterium]
MSDIVLSSAVRSNLLSLQNTDALLARTQERLATGLKVNSALDNPTNFFTASSLNARASDLGNLLDSIGNATQTLEAADNGIEAITDLVESAQSAARQALQDRTNATITSEAADQAVTGATTQATAEATVLTDNGFEANDTLVFTATDSSTNVTQEFTYTVSDGDTVEDLVNSVNSSGFVDATVSQTGVLSFSVGGTESLSIVANVADSAATNNAGQTALTALGFTDSANTTIGTTDPGTDVATLTQAAAGAGASTVRQDLAAQFNELLSQIDELANDSGFNGVNLLGGVTEDLEVVFNETGSSTITIDGVDFSSSGLGLNAVTDDFASDTAIDTQLDDLQGALTTLRSQASTFGANLSIVEARENFTKATINTLETGAANLTLADTNEEGANLLALQTRQQLSSTALSLASQADQNVLRLF